jgi:hypothetical protein
VRESASASSSSSSFSGQGGSVGIGGASASPSRVSMCVDPRVNLHGDLRAAHLRTPSERIHLARFAFDCTTSGQGGESLLLIRPPPLLHRRARAIANGGEVAAERLRRGSGQNSSLEGEGFSGGGAGAAAGRRALEPYSTPQPV